MPGGQKTLAQTLIWIQEALPPVNVRSQRCEACGIRVPLPKERKTAHGISPAGAGQGTDLPQQADSRSNAGGSHGALAISHQLFQSRGCLGLIFEGAGGLQISRSLTHIEAQTIADLKHPEGLRTVLGQTSEQGLQGGETHGPHARSGSIPQHDTAGCGTAPTAMALGVRNRGSVNHLT